METTVMESCVAVADACSVVQGKGMAYRRPPLRLKITLRGKPFVIYLCRRQDQGLIPGTDDEDDDDGETVNSPPLDDDILDHDDASSRLDDGEISVLLQKKKEKKMKMKMKKMNKKNPTKDQILPKQSGEIAEKVAAACTVYRLKIIHDGKVYVIGSRPEHSSSNQEDQERSSNKSKEDGTEDIYHRQKRKHSEEQPSMKKLKPDRVVCARK